MTLLLRRIVSAIRYRFSFVYLTGRLPRRWMIAARYYRAFGTLPDLRNPKTFNEKAQSRKFRAVGKPLAQFVDKIAVKDHVRKIVGDAFVIPTLYAGERLPPLDQRTWPVPFVIKASHGWNMNIFVRDAADLRWPEIESIVARWMRWNHSEENGEAAYSFVKPRVLVEPFVSADGLLPVDYKFFVFGGKVHCIQVNTNRDSHLNVTFFSPSWSKLPFALSGYQPDTADVPRPTSLETMLRVAGDLGRGFEFVRVDLYEIGGAVYFGELTFIPNAGLLGFEPAQVDRQLGDLWLARAA